MQEVKREVSRIKQKNNLKILIWKWIILQTRGRREDCGDGLLVLNTLYEKQMEVQAVQAKLHDAGWRNISAQLVETAGNRLAKWRPRANVIVVAVRE